MMNDFLLIYFNIRNGLFFAGGQNIMLSVVTLNCRALVPRGEYSLSPSFHGGRTHRGPFHCCVLKMIRLLIHLLLLLVYDKAYLCRLISNLWIIFSNYFSTLSTHCESKSKQLTTDPKHLMC